MLLSDGEIQELVHTQRLLKPFDPRNLNSYGYDLTLASEFLVPRLDTEYQVIDPFAPPKFEPKTCEEFIIIPPHHFVLGRSVEYVRMPRDVTGICLGRSTMARAAILTNVTPLESGWQGVVTIEISNSNMLPVKVWVGRGIVQVLFLQGSRLPLKDYVAKGGRYNGQMSVTQGVGGR